MTSNTKNVTLDKTLKIVNNIGVGREPLKLSELKDSATHPTVYNFSAIAVIANASNSIIICFTIANTSFRPISTIIVCDGFSIVPALQHYCSTKQILGQYF